MKKSVALKILGLSSSYTEEDIKQAHRQKIRENHPDRFSDPVKKAEAEEQTKLINEARDVLLNRRWDPEYGPRTGTGYGPYGNPYSNPYGNPYGNPFAGYGGPFSQYGPGAGPQGSPFGGPGQNPFGAGFPFDFVWDAQGAPGSGKRAQGNPFESFFSSFVRKPQKTPEQVLEGERRWLRAVVVLVAAKLVVLGMCAATGASPVGVSIYVLATVLFALFRETSGFARVLAMALAAFVAPMLLRFVPFFLAASMTPLSIVAMAAALGYDAFVLRAVFKSYAKAKREANGGKAE